MWNCQILKQIERMTLMRLFYRILWIIAVAFGGVALVKLAYEKLKIDKKNYMDV